MADAPETSDMASCNRVVLIDDDEDICELISATARTFGIPCTACSSADVFFDELDQETGLVLVDLHMPRVDGIEVLRGLSARRSQVGIVLMSGADERVFTSTEALAKSLGLTILGRLQKPFRVAELESVLTVALRRAASNAKGKPARGHAIPDEDFAAALNMRQLVVHYHPQVSLSNGDVVGMEALVRWDHPKHGLIFPQSFIDRFESLGLIDRLGWAVVEQALHDLTALRLVGGAGIGISLNVSVHSLLDPDFTDRLELLARERSVDVHAITLEVTESGLLRAIPSVRDGLARLRRKGFPVSIDNVGGAYATMSHLKLVPATELKIDRTIIDLMVQNSAERTRVERTIDTGHALGMRIVAEGIETEEQKAIVQAQGCEIAQGYLFSRPLPLDQMLAWLVRRRESAL